MIPKLQTHAASLLFSFSLRAGSMRAWAFLLFARLALTFAEEGK